MKMFATGTAEFDPTCKSLVWDILIWSKLMDK